MWVYLEEVFKIGKLIGKEIRFVVVEVGGIFENGNVIYWVLVWYKCFGVVIVMVV